MSEGGTANTGLLYQARASHHLTLGLNAIWTTHGFELSLFFSLLHLENSGKYISCHLKRLLRELRYDKQNTCAQLPQLTFKHLQAVAINLND